MSIRTLRETFELTFGFETKKHHPYHPNYKKQRARTWLAYAPFLGQLIYGTQLVWLFKKNVRNKVEEYSTEWTARLIRSIFVLSVIGLFIMIALDGIGTLMIHLHAKEKNLIDPQ